jgi:hypothetical protein
MNLVVSLEKKILLAAAVLALGGCSKQPAPAATEPATDAPLVEQSAADAKPAGVAEFHGSFAPGGIQASYRATFNEGRIQAIDEMRKPSTTIAAPRGIYEFRGARLLKYQGAALRSADTLELEFDLQGKVLVARAGEKDASAEEISAIRDRAQSLRSHAVAQYAVRGHDKN